VVWNECLPKQSCPYLHLPYILPDGCTVILSCLIPMMSCTLLVPLILVLTSLLPILPICRRDCCRSCNIHVFYCFVPSLYPVRSVRKCGLTVTLIIIVAYISYSRHLWRLHELVYLSFIRSRCSTPRCPFCSVPTVYTTTSSARLFYPDLPYYSVSISMLSPDAALRGPSTSTR